eukprot:1160835-Pelagomonas_calceolata.AAC.4
MMEALPIYQALNLPSTTHFQTPPRLSDAAPKGNPLQSFAHKRDLSQVVACKLSALGALSTNCDNAGRNMGASEELLGSAGAYSF